MSGATSQARAQEAVRDLVRMPGRAAGGPQAGAGAADRGADAARVHLDRRVVLDGRAAIQDMRPDGTPPPPDPHPELSRTG